MIRGRPHGTLGRWSLVLLFVLIAAYSVYFSALSIQRHNTFRTHASDLGQMDQALWNTLHGHLLEDTRPNGTQAPRLTDHVEPIFLLVSLSYLIYDGVEAILVLQSMAIALGALPIFWIARRRLNSAGAGLVFATIYLLFPALQAANLTEFHAVTLAPAPLLFAYHYAQERAWKRFALFAILALMVKEDIALLVFAMAVWAMIVDGRQWSVVSDYSSPTRARATRNTQHVSRFTQYILRSIRRAPIPAAIALLAVIWFSVALFVIVPRFSPVGGSVYTERYYPGLSRDLSKLVSAVVPLIAGVFTAEKLGYVLGLLASVGFIAVLGPMALLMGSPPLLLNLFSNYYAMYSGTYHYSAPVAPYFVLAAIGGAGTASDWLSRRFGWAHARWIVTLPVLLIALAYHGVAGYAPFGGEFFWPETTPHQQLLARFTNQIPPEVPISTTSSLFPHLSHRRYAYRFPLIQDADYVLLDVSQAATTNPVDFRMNYLGVLEQGFGIRDSADGYILLQRGLPQKELSDAFYDFVRTKATPQHSLTIDFEDKLRFLGYDIRQDDWQRVYLRTYWTRLPGMDNNNYALHPFFVDDEGHPSQELQIPDLLIHFWYPTMRWRDSEIVIADTLPMEVGSSARIGLGVFFGASWEQPERRLAPRSDGPVVGDWVLLGELKRTGEKYIVAERAGD